MDKNWFQTQTGYLFYISADQYYGEWVELFADGYNDTDIEVITHDLRVLLEELEFFAQWMVRDAEDLVHPWVNYTSREVMDSYVFNYTFAAGEIIEITGQTTFRTYKIVEEAYYVRFLGTVKTWIILYFRMYQPGFEIGKVSRKIQETLRLVMYQECSVMLEHGLN